MSLRVWLPLNRDLRNNGLESVTVTNSGATFSNGCAIFNNSPIYGSINGFENYTSFSVSCWVYLTNSNSAQYFFHFGGQTGYPCKIGLYYQDSVLWTMFNGTGEYNTGVSLELNKWYHIVMTLENGIANIYRNGIKVYTITYSGSFTPSNHYAIGGRTNSAEGNTFSYMMTSGGKIYDVRLYDHALSKKEVVELARGCVLHYPMNDTLNESTINLVPNGKQLGWNWSYQKITEYPSGINPIGSVYKRTNTDAYFGSASEFIDDYEIPNNYAGTYMTLSCWYYRMSANSPELSFWVLGDNGTSQYTGITTVTKKTNTSVIGKWTYASVTVQFPTNMSQYSKITYFHDSGGLNDDFYITNVQIEKKDHATPYTPNIRNAYNEYEYLQSDGTAYINTGAAYDSTKSTYKVECKFSMPESIGTYDGVFGAYTNESCKCLRIIRASSNSSLWFYYNTIAGGSNNRITVSSSNSNIKEVIITSTTLLVTENGVTTTYTFPSPNGNTTTSTFYLFDQAAGSITSKTRLYYWRLYDGSTLIRDMIPVQYNGVNGMWDRVENKFYPNSNSSGSFTLGPLVKGNYLKDVSGFDNHSLITGSLPLVTTPKSPRYDKCMNIDNSGTNKNYANCTIAAPQVKSASFWVYIGSSNPTNQIIFMHNSSHICAGFGSDGNIYYYGGPAETKIPCGFNINTTTKKNAWNHFIVNHLGTAMESWLNGVKLTNPISDYWSLNDTGDFYLGERNRGNTSYPFTGKLSDFRLFSRVLTQADVDDLYKDSLSIDKSQNGYCYELNESDAQSSVDVKKNGQLKCKNYSEQFDGLYLPAGTWVDTQLNYTTGDICKAETFIKYDAGGSGRDLMGVSPSDKNYWGVTADGIWESWLPFSYTDSNITKYNRIVYDYTLAGSGGGAYLIGTLTANPSTRNKTIYHVKLWKNGVLERDLYPCSINNQCGLIDGLTGTFYPANNSNASLVSGTVEAKIGKNGLVQANQINEY